MRHLLQLGLTIAWLAGAQRPTDPPRSSGYPFGVGESFTYHAKVGFIGAGSGSMRVEDVEDVRGHPCYHAVFDVNGHVLFFHAHDHSETWFDTTDLVSRHQTQTIDETGDHATRVYDFYPDRRIYVRNDTTGNSVAEPLDETAFLYYLRTLPLEAGKTFTIDRHYHLEKNPIVITVERRERVKVPAGEFEAFVLHPVMKSRGLFEASRHTEVWIADDSTRAIVQLKSKLPVGTFNLELTKAEYANRR